MSAVSIPGDTAPVASTLVKPLTRQAVQLGMVHLAVVSGDVQARIHHSAPRTLPYPTTPTPRGRLEAAGYYATSRPSSRALSVARA
jgi:hypothetical protein